MKAAAIFSGGWSPLGALRRSDADVAASMLRLATGKRINRAADGPADMVTIESLKADSADLSGQNDSLERENYRLAAQDGAMSVVDDLLTDLRGLTVAAANTGGMSDAEREGAQVETDSIIEAISQLSDTSTYQGERLLEEFDPASMGLVQAADGQGGSADYTLADLATGGRLAISGGDAGLAERVAKAAEEQVAMRRGSVGAQMYANESRTRALVSQHEGTEAARSLIEDTDYAAEVTRLVRAQTMREAALYTTALAQHNQGTVLKLLQDVK